MVSSHLVYISIFVSLQGMMKEFEMCVVLTKLWRGNFGFTITRSKLDACYYIQDILDNPAKTDGRLRPGDRLVTVHQWMPLKEERLIMAGMESMEWYQLH